MNDAMDPSLTGGVSQPFGDIFRPNKRTANVPASPETLQKRAKLATEQASAGAVPMANMGQSPIALRGHSSAGSRSGSGQNASLMPDRSASLPGTAPQYLFAPFPAQPAPLLGPIHTSTTADTAWSDELGRIAQGFDGLKFEQDGQNFLFDPFMGGWVEQE